MVVISWRNQNGDRMSCVFKSLQKKKKVLAKFHVNSNFLLLRNNSDNKYMTPQTTALEEIRL